MSRRRKSNAASPESDSHFVQLMEWLAMESQAEAEQMAEKRRLMSSAQAEKTGETLLDLAIVDHRPGLGGRYLVKFAKRKPDVEMPWHRLKVGSPVIVSEFSIEHPDQFKEKDAVSGVISKRSRDSVEVAMGRWVEGKSFRIDLTSDEVTRQRQLDALRVAKDSRGRLGHLRRVLLGRLSPVFKWRSQRRSFSKRS